MFVVGFARSAKSTQYRAPRASPSALTAADEHWLTDVLFSLALGPVLLAGLVAAEPFTRPLWPGEPVRGRYPRI